ncbi:MAG: hypothetical protein K9G26_03075 [Emcibacter sp.]|nr:hypothetical protein [Emcibacter sp.]
MSFIAMDENLSKAQDVQNSSQHTKNDKLITPEIYTIYNISVDKTSGNALSARKEAVREAQHMALEKLFRKIISEEDINKLPILNDDQITEFVNGLEVKDEKSSHVRYLADFTVHFSREKIYDFLSRQNIAFAETLSKPVSILTVLEKDGVALLWEDINDWRDAWNAYDTINNLVPISIIQPSLLNVMNLTAWQSKQGNQKLLQKYADQQGVRKLYVMSARLENDFIHGRKILLLTILGNDDERYDHRTDITVDPSWNDNQYSRALYNEAIKQATYWLDNQWKKKVMVHFSASSHFNVTVQYDKGADWFKIKQKLENLSLIRKMTYRNIMVNSANIDIEHSGDIEQLMLTLDQENLVLTEKLDNAGNSNWLLGFKEIY